MGWKAHLAALGIGSALALGFLYEAKPDNSEASRLDVQVWEGEGSAEFLEASNSQAYEIGRHRILKQIGVTGEGAQADGSYVFCVPTREDRYETTMKNLAEVRIYELEGEFPGSGACLNHEERVRDSGKMEILVGRSEPLPPSPKNFVKHSQGESLEPEIVSCALVKTKCFKPGVKSL